MIFNFFKSSRTKSLEEVTRIIQKCNFVRQSYILHRQREYKCDTYYNSEYKSYTEKTCELINARLLEIGVTFKFDIYDDSLNYYTEFVMTQDEIGDIITQKNANSNNTETEWHIKLLPLYKSINEIFKEVENEMENAYDPTETQSEKIERLMKSWDAKEYAVTRKLKQD